MRIDSSRRGATAQTHAGLPLRLRAWLWLAIGLLTCLGCQREHVAHYRCRGVVRAIEGRGDDARIAIQHEALPAFMDRDGKVAPMSAMMMIFGLAPNLRDKRHRLNEKVSFEFDVTWHDSPFLTITRVEPLPPQTELVLLAREGPSGK